MEELQSWHTSKSPSRNTSKKTYQQPKMIRAKTVQIAHVSGESAHKQINKGGVAMLIHDLTNYINEHKDDNIKVVVKQHPLSGMEDSQVLLTFKRQKVKISLAQFSPEGYMYLCIIAKKTPRNLPAGSKLSGGTYNWTEVYCSPFCNKLDQIYTLITRMADHTDRFYDRSMPIGIKTACERVVNI